MAVGNAVAFVLWFNFVGGFAYIAAGVGLLVRTRWAAPLSALIASLTVLVALALRVHIVFGGAYELRTVGDMIVRSLVWIGIYMAARRMASAIASV